MNRKCIKQELYHKSTLKLLLKMKKVEFYFIIRLE